MGIKFCKISAVLDSFTVRLQAITCNCYLGIRNVFVKRNWLIHDHVASDKCNVSRRTTSDKLLLAASKTNFKSYMELPTKK